MRTIFSLPVTTRPRYFRFESDLLSVSAAADALSVSRWQIYQLMDSGQLRSVHVGRRRLIARQDLRVYVQRLREQGDPS